MATSIDCPVCRGTGWFTDVRDGVSGARRCECMKRDRTGRLVEGARIPGRYAHCELSMFATGPSLTTRSLDQAKFIAERFVEEYPTSPPMGLLFMGNPGVGKTHLAVGILKRLIHEKGVACLFRTFPELLKEIQNSYNPNTRTSELSLLSPVLDVEVLALDELGAQNPSAWVRDTVGYILNHRYNENRVTILTTNFPDEAERRDGQKSISESLTDRIGDRMRSRLYEMCKTVPMAGKDFRQNIRHANHHF